MPYQLLFVFLGGGTGAVMRCLLALWIPREAGAMPWATLAVNLTGCFLFGAVTQWLQGGGGGDLWRALLLTGVMGGLTTFSTCCFEGVALWREGAAGLAAGYTFLSLAAGWASVWAGMRTFA